MQEESPLMVVEGIKCQSWTHRTNVKYKKLRTKITQFLLNAPVSDNNCGFQKMAFVPFVRKYLMA